MWQMVWLIFLCFFLFILSFYCNFFLLPLSLLVFHFFFLFPFFSFLLLQTGDVWTHREAQLTRACEHWVITLMNYKGILCDFFREPVRWQLASLALLSLGVARGSVFFLLYKGGGKMRQMSLFQFVSVVCWLMTCSYYMYSGVTFFFFFLLFSAFLFLIFCLICYFFP